VLVKWIGPRGLAAISGILLGAGGVLLAVAGNPENTGVCVSCFLVNWAGSLGVFSEARMSYPRPELPAFVIGSFLAATLVGGFRPKLPTAPLRLILASAAIIIGCEVFMGCPIKLVLRLGAGDLTAVAGVAGLVAGIWLGTRLLVDGFELPRRPAKQSWGGYVLPIAALMLAAAAYLRLPALAFGETGPAAAHAPMAISLGFGLVVGALAQRSRFCVTGALRNFFLARDRTLLIGLGLFLAAAFAVALATDTFRIGYADQPGVHPDALWNFLGMLVAGLGAVAVGGCPFRQLVLSGTGDAAAAISIASRLATAGASRALGISSTVDGPTWAGKVALLALLSFLLLPLVVTGLSRGKSNFGDWKMSLGRLLSRRS
jgi:YedE family putative selenium metabolism protein